MGKPLPRWDLRHGEAAVGIIGPPGKALAGYDFSRPGAGLSQLAGVTTAMLELPRVVVPGLVDVAVLHLSTSKRRNRQRTCIA